MITYASGKEIVPYTDVKRSDNSTNEKDSAGAHEGLPKAVMKAVLSMKKVTRCEKTHYSKELMPEVKGVLVVAEGASDATVKENLVNSVKVLLDIPVHKIQVVERGK